MPLHLFDWSCPTYTQLHGGFTANLAALDCLFHVGPERTEKLPCRAQASECMDKIPHSRPLLGPEEAQAAARVVASGMLAEGPEVQALEELLCLQERLPPRRRRGSRHRRAAPQLAGAGHRARPQSAHPQLRLRFAA